VNNGGAGAIRRPANSARHKAMDPSQSTGPARAGLPIEVIVADPAWRRAIPHAAALATRAARASGSSAITILLSSDRVVRRLNARHRGQDKPTNVLTFDPPAPGLPGQIVLALGVVRREAGAAARPPAHHLAHLVVHGALHLAGYDHHRVGDARRMERAEARILHRLAVPNPWKRVA
jgi:probable rRNA maturation factor